MNMGYWSLDRNARQQLTARRQTPTIRPFRATQGLPPVHITASRRADDLDSDPSQISAQMFKEGKPGIQVTYVNPQNPNAYRGIAGRIYYSLLQFLAGSR